MPKCPLYERWTWNRPMPDPFDDPSVPTVRTDVHSQYSGTITKSTMHAASLAAILAYMCLDHAAELPAGQEAKGALGSQGNNYYLAEYPSRTGKTHLVVFNRTNGKFSAVSMKDAGDSPNPYALRDNAESGAALFFALMPLAVSDEEFAQAYEKLWGCIRDGLPDLDAAARYAALCCDNLYRRLTAPSACGSAGISISLSTTGNIPPIRALNLKQGTYDPTSVLIGKFEILGNAPKTAAKSVRLEDFVGKYPLHEIEWSAEQEAMIPKPEPWYSVPHEIVTLCRHIQQTTDSAQPIRTAMLRGPAGTGKTEGVKALAAALHRPYVYLTCNANFEIYDFLGQVMPDMSKPSAHKATLPSLQDIQMDPPSAYYQMTGDYIETVTEEQVFDKLLEVMAERAQSETAQSQQRYTYVDTPLVQALRYGYVCELQEPNVIANPGVMVGLNALLDRCAAITLPTGERLVRHPDCVIVVTTNAGYEGTRDMNQSVLSRMSLILDMEQPDNETMADRVAALTGCPDKGMIVKMAEVVQNIDKRCRTNMIQDGCCGMRELIAWVQSYMIVHDAMESAEYTVLSSVSADPENREDIRTNCLAPAFGT